MSTIELIQKAIAEKDMTLHGLVISLNLPTQTAANWKRGKSRQYMKLLPEISKKIGVSVKDLQAAADEKEQKAMTGTPRGRKAGKSAAATPAEGKKAAKAEKAAKQAEDRKAAKPADEEKKAAASAEDKKAKKAAKPTEDRKAAKPADEEKKAATPAEGKKAAKAEKAAKATEDKKAVKPADEEKKTAASAEDKKPTEAKEAAKATEDRKTAKPADEEKKDAAPAEDKKAKKAAKPAEEKAEKPAKTGETNGTLALIMQKMEEQKISLMSFCSDMGIKKSTFYNWRNGLSRTYMKMLPEISKYLGLSLEELNASDGKQNEEKKSLLAEMDEIFSELTSDAQEVLISMAKMLKK